ncbi:hypothetical protein B0H15DRAFT_946660 [Mycena belliarum]|uniref:Uncharacterized protein n=1 Tax=Mycena belliarum TaxID=1033014 RepID=A0AAD6XRZ0_9AGAR|nr:hypothetical protein B0H15DRAFT_946660 [Mycena belliae]
MRPLARAVSALRRAPPRQPRPLLRPSPRSYATRPKTPVGEWYTSILPAMFPISLLASAVYTALLLAQLTLSHEQTMDEQAVRLAELEAEVDALHRARKPTA